MTNTPKRKLIILAFVSLDGVMQAPGGPQEDTSDGFEYGGWTVPFSDENSGKEMVKQMSEPFDLLLGRKTYDIFAGYWPKQEDSFIGKVFNKATKYVVTSKPLETDWPTTVPISGDVPGEIAKIKQQEGPDLQVHGSVQLNQTLLKHGLVDEIWLKTFPVILGSGKNLFGGEAAAGAFELVYSQVTPGGIVFANYRRNGNVKTGSF
jgi:dihydrofolate reductase